MDDDRSTGSEFTGRHMLAIMLAFFGVIIAVNVTMAMMARSSWSGLVVANSYVASQEFNRKAEEGRRQAALGWRSTLTVADGRLRFELADADGEAVRLAGGTASLRRPVGDAEDMTLTLAVRNGALEAGLDARDGLWIVEVLADAGLEKPYRETRRLQLQGGVVR